MTKKHERACRVLVGSALLAALVTQQAWAQYGTAKPEAAPNPAAASSSAEPTGPTVRPELGTPLLDAQRLIGEKNYAEASAKVSAAQAVANPTPYELHIIARVKGALATATGDAKMAAEQYEIATQGPWLKQSDKIARLQGLVALYYNAKNFGKAIEWIDKYYQAGGEDQSLKMVLAQCYYLNGQYADAAKALDVELNKILVSGKVPTEIQFRLLADSRNRMKDEAGYSKTLEALVEHYPTQTNWRSLITRLWAKPQLATRIQLDVFRLQMITAGFADDTDYTEMAALALQDGSAIEASKVLEQGYAAGVLVAANKSAELQKLTDKATKQAGEDRNTLEKDVLRAKTLPDGLAMFNYGFNLVQLGQTERGVTQMEQGLAKGIARNPELAKLRLISVYATLKQFDKANQLLAALSAKPELVGMDECLRYWKLFLRKV